MDDRPGQLLLTFPTLDIAVRCDLLWDTNPDLCELMARSVPFDTHYAHTLASGEGMYAPTRMVGTVPGTCELLSEMAPGTLTLSTTNYKSLGAWYGVVTEALPATPVACAIAEDLPLLKRAGREVWFATISGHTPVPVHVSLADSPSEGN